MEAMDGEMAANPAQGVLFLSSGEKTMIWYCIATERDEERRTAHELARHGFPVWLPEEFRCHMPRKRAPARSWHVPILSQTLFAAIPVALHGEIAILAGKPLVWRDSEYAAIPVPYRDIQRFREEIDARNVVLQRHFQRLLDGVPSKKPEIYKGFDELRAWYDRKSTMEIAA